MTWTNQTTIVTNWDAETRRDAVFANTDSVETTYAILSPFIQIIELINNTYNINYGMVDINGKSIRKWDTQTSIETAWVKE